MIEYRRLCHRHAVGKVCALLSIDDSFASLRQLRVLALGLMSNATQLGHGHSTTRSCLHLRPAGRYCSLTCTERCPLRVTNTSLMELRLDFLRFHDDLRDDLKDLIARALSCLSVVNLLEFGNQRIQEGGSVVRQAGDFRILQFKPAGSANRSDSRLAWRSIGHFKLTLTSIVSRAV